MWQLIGNIKGKDGRDGTDGESARVDTNAIVSEVLRQVPVPKDGLIGPQGERGLAGAKGDQGERGEPGLPGDRGFDGKDGKSVNLDEVQSFLMTAIENRASKWELDFELRAQKVFQRAIDKMPVPKDGKDGRDGFNVEDMTVHHDGDGLVTFTFSRGELTKAFQIRLPRFMDQGVYKTGTTYRQGDGVTYDRAYWICQKDEPVSGPAEGSDWRLAVRAGRDGKNGVITQDYIPPKISLK